MESQLLQHESSGTVRFDIDAGRVLGQQVDVDKGVVGFRGEASSIHQLMRFTENLAVFAAQGGRRRLARSVATLRALSRRVNCCFVSQPLGKGALWHRKASGR